MGCREEELGRLTPLSGGHFPRFCSSNPLSWRLSLPSPPVFTRLGYKLRVVQRTWLFWPVGAVGRALSVQDTECLRSLNAAGTAGLSSTLSCCQQMFYRLKPTEEFRKRLSELRLIPLFYPAAFGVLIKMLL